MTTSVRFCLSYDPLKLDFIAFKVDDISRRKRIDDTDVVNDFTFTRESGPIQYRDQTWFFMHYYLPGPEGGAENRGQRPRFSTAPGGPDKR